MFTSSVDRDPFEQLAEEFAERLRRGEHPSLTEYIARCPDRAEDIRELFPALAMVERFKPSGDGPAIPFAPEVPPVATDLPDRLGDYRILRYLGEGGMGVVYEAMRESLRSHVALKVMHPQFRNRENYLRRFRTEARSAARLHHTNIVSVFDYGTHDGVCYYAMQYIAGHSLDKVLQDIQQLRREKENERLADAPETVGEVDGGERSPADWDGFRAAGCSRTDSLRRTATMGLLTGGYPTAPPAEDSEAGNCSVLQEPSAPVAEMETADPIAICAANLALGIGSTMATGTEQTEPLPGGLGVDRSVAPAEIPTPPERPADAPDQCGPVETSSGSTASSLSSRTDDRYYREVARLGAQVADALAYAHQRGVLHRDVKPPNLILDPLGNIWITDFGLAKSEEGDDFSQSHDLVGTLRYMAPERFRGISTARCDVYALGATLYEMMTLRPPFEGKDQLQLIHMVENDPPIPPRQIERRIPRDLETIVLKALAKSPDDRFDTAKEMADELRLFLENRPIHSRPIPAYQHLWRWCKRNPGLAGACLTAFALMIILAIGSPLAAWTFRDQRNQIRTHLEKVESSEAGARAVYKEGRIQLFQALFDRARAQRHGRQVGHRFRSLAALEEAVPIGSELKLPPEKFEALRDEAIACFALPDLKPTGREITQPPNVIATAFEPTMTRYALRFRDGTISVRRFSDDQELASFPRAARGDRDFWVFHFSPDGRYLASMDVPGQGVKVWDVGQVVIAVHDPGPVGPQVRFSPDGRRIVLVRQGKLLDYDLATGRLDRTWPDRASDLAFRPDGARIAVVDNESKRPACRILEAESGRLVQKFDLRASANWAAWSPDGHTLATPCQDMKIDLWDTTTGIRRATLEGHTNYGMNAAFHPAGTLLASNDFDGRLRLWDPILGRPVLSLSGGRGPEFSRDGRIVVSLEDKLTTYQVDPALEYRTLAHASRERMDYHRPSIRQDGRLLAVGTDRGVILWDLPRDTELAFLPVGDVWGLMFEPSGDLITSGSAGVQRWSIRLDPGRVEVRIGPPRQLPFPASDCQIAEDCSGQIVALANHNYAYVASAGRTIPVGPLDDCRGVAVSPDGQWLATGSHIRGAQVWRIADRTKMVELPIDTRGATVLFSADGKWLTAGGRLWEVGTWRETRRISERTCFSPDGRWVVVIDPSRIIRLVEIATDRTLARLESPDLCATENATFSPDGSRLVITTNDGPAVHVWDLRAIRRHLAGMGLDWDAPAYPDTDPATEEASAPLSNIVVNLGPFKPELHSLLKQAEQLEATGQIGPAIEQLRQAVRMSPDFAEVHNSLAWLLATAPGPLRKLGEALRHALRAVELAPDEHLNLNTLGVVLYRTGRFADAIEILEKSLKAGAGRLAAFDLFFLAMAHHRLNHLEQSRDCWKQADCWFEANRKNLTPQYLKELTAFRAEAEAVLAGLADELP